jgi:signal transduction histidine kinase
MKKAALIQTCLGFLFVLCLGTAIAQEQATKEECIAKCKEAAALINEVGVDAATAKIQDVHGPFVWKDSYVYVAEMEGGKVLAHPMSPGMVGKSWGGLKDANGKMFGAELIEVARKGEGWVEYVWPKGSEKKLCQKQTYVYRVPGKDIYVAAGVWLE